MKKLIILQGPPACGKSTWCKNYLNEHLDTVVVSRDTIRHSMGEYNMDHENKVTELEDEYTITAMQGGVETIINDATNLNPKYLPKWETLAAEYGYDVEYKEFYIPYKEALKRDKNPDRAHHVGPMVLKSFYKRYYPDRLDAELYPTETRYRVTQDQSLPKAIICDIDGTVALMNHRSPFDWNAVDTDKPDVEMVNLISRLLSTGVTVLFVSGRWNTKECHEKTYNWLVDNIPYFKDHLFDSCAKLFMCKNKDSRGDKVIKPEIYENEIKDKYNVICCFDDRDRSVSCWRDLGLLCCQVASGDF